MSRENIIAFSSMSGVMRHNPDGSLNIYCRMCRNFICTVDGKTRIGSSAICQVCECDMRGEVLSQSQVDDMRAVRMLDGRLLPQSLFKDKPEIDPVTGKDIEDTDVVTGNNLESFFRVLTDGLRAAGKLLPKRKKKKKASTEIAEEKRPRRLFEGGITLNVKHNKDDDSE